MGFLKIRGPVLDPSDSIWMFLKIGGFTPQVIHFNRGFHYKPSILGCKTTPIFGNTLILRFKPWFFHG